MVKFPASLSFHVVLEHMNICDDASFIQKIGHQFGISADFYAAKKYHEMKVLSVLYPCKETFFSEKS